MCSLSLTCCRFLFVVFSLDELARVGSAGSTVIRRTLAALPSALDDKYARILAAIPENDHPLAFTLLEWVAYAQQPLHLDELKEALVAEGFIGRVHTNERSSYQDTLQTLSGLVAIFCIFGHSLFPDSGHASFNRHANYTSSEDCVHLAHSSVLDFLESDRASASAVGLPLRRLQGHDHLRRSCLAYLTHYSSSSQRRNTTEDYTTFPLLLYASSEWYTHLEFSHADKVEREVQFLVDDNLRQAWLNVYRPDEPERPSGLVAPQITIDTGTAVYYASFLGLTALLKALLARGLDVNGHGGYYFNAVQAAAFRGKRDIVSMLIAKGADINARGGRHGTALQAAAYAGEAGIVEMLLAHGADVNARESPYGNSLQVAASQGHSDVVKILLARGADINTPGGLYGTALQAAITVDSTDIDLLYKFDILSWKYVSAFLEACEEGRADIVRLMLNRGSDANEPACLVQAAAQGRIEIVRMLLDAGVDVNQVSLWVSLWTGDYFFGTALEAAIAEDQIQVVRLLKQHGSNIDAGDLIVEAAERGYLGIVLRLIKAGVDIDVEAKWTNTTTAKKERTNALTAAAANHHKDIVDLLISTRAAREHNITSAVDRLGSDIHQAEDDSSSDESIHSLASELSLVSSGSANTSMDDEQPNLINQYILQVCSDPTLYSLLQEAARKMAGRADRFVRNHARLLKMLHRDLCCAGQVDSVTRRFASKTFRKSVSQLLLNHIEEADLAAHVFADVRTELQIEFALREVTVA